MLKSIPRVFQNYHKIHKLQSALFSYQFKVERPVYYPNRHIEMQRINEQLKSQLVHEKQQKKKLPKDYYYKILGVNRAATTAQIKAAYYALAKRFHPDANNSAHETKRFQEISNAYHILSDDNKRLEYDQLGVVKDEQTFLKNAANINDLTTNKKIDINIPATREEIINMTNGEPRLELTFLEAAHGVKKNIDLRFLKKCPTCNGKSPKMVRHTGNPELCRKCNGAGQITKKTPTFTSITVCDQCQGKRYLNRNQCDTCDNRGIVLETVKVVVPVPSGVKTGDTVPIDNPMTKQRVSYRIKVKESDYYHRVGNDVLTDRYLTISEAVLGGLVKVRGIYEDMDVKVEPGTESHTKVVINAKGIRTREGIGDHIVTFKVLIPRILSMKQRQLILALAKTEEPTFQRAG